MAMESAKIRRTIDGRYNLVLTKPPENLGSRLEDSRSRFCRRGKKGSKNNTKDGNHLTDRETKYEKQPGAGFVSENLNLPVRHYPE